MSKINLEVGMYQEAASKGLPFSVFIEDHAVKEWGWEPTIYDGKCMLERNAIRRSLKAEGKEVPLTHFEKLLGEFGIRAYGYQTDNVSKFFQNANVATLFPEYISNRIYAGQLMAALIDPFLAETIVIQGLEFKKIYLEDTEVQRNLVRATRATEFGRTRINVAEQSVKLAKFGRILEFDYEVIQDSPLSLYNIALQRVGQQFGISMTDEMIYVLLNGDGNSNGLESAQTKTTATSGTISKKDVITFNRALPAPYKLDNFVGKKTKLIDYDDTMSDMTNPNAQWGQTSISLAKAHEWDRSVVTSDRFIGVDSRYAIGLVTNDTVMMTETDRIVQKQTVEAVVSTRFSYNVIDQDAIGCLDIDH